MKVFKAHVYFEACASFDVPVGLGESRKEAEIAARKWFGSLVDPVIDTDTVVDGRRVHLEDPGGDINCIDVEEEPYEKEKPE
jgi:hypothetical protein